MSSRGEAGPKYKFRNLEFWAERGMITLVHVENAGNSEVKLDKAIKRLSARQFLKQAIAGFDSLPDVYPSEVREANNFLMAAKAAVKLAISQGDPTNPKVIEHRLKHDKKAQILLPGDVRLQKRPPTGPCHLAKGDPVKLITGEECIRIVPDFVLEPNAQLHPKIFRK